VITTWSIKILHHRNHDMRDRDEIWTVRSLEISTLIRLDKVHKFAKYKAPFGAACGHRRWSREGKKLAVISSISKSRRSRLGVSKPFITGMSKCEVTKFKLCLVLGHNCGHVKEGACNLLGSIS
jgi:hypothetical protein